MLIKRTLALPRALSHRFWRAQTYGRRRLHLCSRQSPLEPTACRRRMWRTKSSSRCWTNMSANQALADILDETVAALSDLNSEALQALEQRVVMLAQSNET